MAPPAYGDIGREARDILTKNYHSGHIKVNIKSKTPIDVELCGSGQTHIETGKLDGSLEAKYQLPNIGTVIKQKYTPTLVTTDVSINKLPLAGAKLGLVNTLSHSSGFKNLVIKSGYINPLLNLGVDVDLSKSGTQVTASAVLAHDVGQLGTQLVLKGNELSKMSGILGYKTKHLAINTSATYSKELELGALIYHRLAHHVYLGAQLKWVPSTLPKCEVGVVSQVSKNTRIRAMVSSSREVGVGVTQNLRHGVTLTLSAQANDKCLKPTLGLGIEIDS